MNQMGAPVGNTNAKKAKLFEGAIKRALAREYGSVDAGLDKLAEKLIADALTDAQARRDVADRIDGKPPQGLTVGGDEENPLRLTGVTRKIVEPSGT